jgi:hypothetical protein
VQRPVILIHPPLAKACEPPAGIAKLAGFLRQHGVGYRLLDANLEGTLDLLYRPLEPSDTWTKRATHNLGRNLQAVRDWSLYCNHDRYRRVVADLNRVLSVNGEKYHARVSLSDYQHESLSPIRSTDLLWLAEHPEADPFYSYFSIRLRAIVEETSPRVVGFSLSYLSQALCTCAMAGFLRREFPKLRLVFGGSLVTSWVRNPGWRNPFTGLVDHIVDGPGEYPLLKILGERPISCQQTSPQFCGLPMDEYLAPGPVVPYATSSGCYWGQCSFCPERAEGNEYRPIAPDQAVEQLASLTLECKPALLHLVDNALSPALLKSITAQPPGAPWYGFARITPGLADPDHARALRRSGCVMLKLGLESADQRVLDSMRKGHDVETARGALRTLRKEGIATYVYLLFGTPQETEGPARKTLGFVVEEAESIDFLNLAIFNLPVGSAEAHELQTEPFYDGDLSLYVDFRHPNGWERKRVRRFIDNEFKRHQAVQAMLKHHPPFFTSNHAPLFQMVSDCASLKA